eukprot:6480102-Amphidinium_carterae.1
MEERQHVAISLAQRQSDVQHLFDILDFLRSQIEEVSREVVRLRGAVLLGLCKTFGIKDQAAALAMLGVGLNFSVPIDCLLVPRTSRRELKSVETSCGYRIP